MTDIFKYTKELMLLSFPIILGQLGQMLIGVGDVYIASMYQTDVLASVGVANGILNPFFLFGVGLMMGISPSLAMKRGSRDVGSSRSSLTSIISYSFVTGLLLTLVTLFVANFIPYFGFDERLIPSMELYISIVAWSFPFALVFQGIKEYLQGFEDVFMANFLSIVAVILNLAVNYVLVFGFMGIGGYGEVGLAIASFGIRIFLCLGILVYAVKKESLTKLSVSLIWDFFKFSLPVACMFFIEVLAFAGVTLFSGQIGVVAAAANNLVMNMAGVAFMIPLSISSAVAVKVGYALGEKNMRDIKLYTLASLAIGSIFIIFSSLAFFGFPKTLLSFASKDLEVIELGVKLLFVVALFQAADSVQVILSGVLRGLNSTKISFIIIFIGYWVIGIPVGYYLAFSKNYGAEGLWIGLAISLGVVALVLSFYSYNRFRTIKI